MTKTGHKLASTALTGFKNAYSAAKRGAKFIPKADVIARKTVNTLGHASNVADLLGKATGRSEFSGMANKARLVGETIDGGRRSAIADRMRHQASIMNASA